VTNILLILNMSTFYCCWFKRDVAEKKSESLRFHWSVSAHRESRYAGRDVSLAVFKYVAFSWETAHQLTSFVCHNQLSQSEHLSLV
jgi:hypothetical protein